MGRESVSVSPTNSMKFQPTGASPDFVDAVREPSKSTYLRGMDVTKNAKGCAETHIHIAHVVGPPSSGLSHIAPPSGSI
jgi:hypothetical protein